MKIRGRQNEHAKLRHKFRFVFNRMFANVGARAGLRYREPVQTSFPRPFWWNRFALAKCWLCPSFRHFRWRPRTRRTIARPLLGRNNIEKDDSPSDALRVKMHSTALQTRRWHLTSGKVQYEGGLASCIVGRFAFGHHIGLMLLSSKHISKLRRMNSRCGEDADLGLAMGDDGRNGVGNAAKRNTERAAKDKLL